MNNTRYPKLLVFLATTFLLFGCGSDDVLTPNNSGTGTTPGTTDPALIDTFIGSSSGTNFTEGALEIKINTVEAFGSTVVSAYIVDSAFTLSTESHTVTFTSDCAVQLLASFSSTSVITTTGIATTTYNDLGCQLNDSISASVTLDSVVTTASGSVTINSATTPQITTVRIGTGTGTGFTNGALDIAPNAISATGSSAISVNLVDDAGTLLTTPQTVTFGSTCVDAATPLANLSATTVPTSNGTASTTYTASGCTNTDTLTASVTANGTIISATGTLTIAQPAAGSIQFTSVSAQLIALQGTGSTSGLPETSNVIFSVLDSIGTPVSGENVTFTLDSNLPGVSLATTTATSNINGEVVATVQSGTVATSVRVTATLDSNDSLVTTSSAIVIATGPPDQDSMTLSAVTLNPRAWNLNGTTVELTIQLADRFNNPIQDGTSISFVTELGRVDPNCSTVNGECIVEWHSQSPKDNVNVSNNAGRTTILATVKGEESFVDVDGNGVFSNGDIFDDLPEAFLDDDEDGNYDVTEEFTNFDGSIGDGPFSTGWNDVSGTYNGPGCTHSSLCDDASDSIDVRDSLVLVMAEDNPSVYGVGTNLGTPCDTQATCNGRAEDLGAVPPITAVANTYPSVFNLGAGGVSYATFAIAGLANGEVLPFGTQVKFTATNGKITAGASHTVGNSTGIHNPNPNPEGEANITADTLFTVFLAPDNTSSADGVLNIEVKIGEDGGTFSFAPIALTDFAPVRIGTGSGTGFNEGQLTVSEGNPEAGVDTVTIDATIVDINGTLITDPTNIIFTSGCSEETIPTAIFTDAFVNTTDGNIQTVYTPLAGCVGPDIITATIIGSDPEQIAETTVFVK